MKIFSILSRSGPPLTVIVFVASLRILIVCVFVGRKAVLGLGFCLVLRCAGAVGSHFSTRMLCGADLPIEIITTIFTLFPELLSHRLAFSRRSGRDCEYPASTTNVGQSSLFGLAASGR